MAKAPSERFETMRESRIELESKPDYDRSIERIEAWFDVEYQIEAFLDSIRGRDFNGETFPIFWPNLGPDVYAAFYGCPLVYGGVTSWALHCVESAADLERLRFAPEGEYMRTLDALTRRALELAPGRFIVGFTDLHPGIDAAAWRGQERLCLDLYDDPDFAHAIIDLASRDFGRIYDHFDLVLKAAGQPSVNWMGIPAAGKLHVPSCDFASMLSPAHFDEFVYLELATECRMMSRNIFHIDGRGVARHLDRLLELPGVQAYQWVQGVGDDEPIMQWIPVIRRIRDKGKGVVVDLKADELGPFMEAVGPRGIYLCIGSSSEEEELSVLRRLEVWR